MNPQDFGWALGALKLGCRVTRQGWNGRGMWLALQVPDAHSKMTLPYVYMRTVQGDLVPWLASQTDILSVDWVLANEGGGAMKRPMQDAFPLGWITPPGVKPVQSWSGRAVIVVSVLNGEAPLVTITLGESDHKGELAHPERERAAVFFADEARKIAAIITEAADLAERGAR